MFHGFLRPGQGFRRFTVLERKGGLSENGRPQSETFTPTGEIIGMLMLASHEATRQWKDNDSYKQNVHKVLYQIIQYGTANRAKPADILEWKDGEKVRRFTINGIHDLAGLHHFTAYFAEEREDFQ